MGYFIFFYNFHCKTIHEKIISLDSIRNPESTRKEKKINKTNYFLMFDFTMEKYGRKSKFLKIVYILKFLSPYVIEINK